MDTVKVHVHLYYGVDPRHFKMGDQPGCLYGYHHAESAQMVLSYAEDHPESRPLRLARRALKALLGFDFIHTWRNRAALRSADVVWTHTEREYLSAALLLLLSGRRDKPLLLAQSVWLLDRWPTLSLPRRLFYRWLLGRADVLTTLSTDNAALGRKYWGREVLPLLYGMSTDDFPMLPVERWTPHTPLRVAAIGNDRDRDWDTFITAFADDPAYTVRAATQRHIARHPRPANIEIAPVNGLAAQRALYQWADVIVVPLHPNHHASGITVMLEAVLSGKPVVATAGGGLQDYFADSSVRYVPSHDPLALRNCVAALAAAPADTTALVRRAQSEFLAKDLTAAGFARQHVALTHTMVQGVDWRDTAMPHAGL